MVVAAAVFGVAITHLVRDVARTDAVFPAAGVHRVNLPAGVERGVFAEEGRRLVHCRAVDDRGAEVDFRRPGSRFTYDQWVALRVFDTGDGRLTFTCSAASRGDLRIASVPSTGDLAQLGLLGLLLPMALGTLGLVIVVVTAILWFIRRPARPAPPGWQPGPPIGRQPPS
jgi:hypothetical protein